MPTKAPVEPTADVSTPRPLTVEDLAALIGAIQQPAESVAPTPEQIAASLGLTVAELDTVREVAIQRSKRGVPVPDHPLDAPIRFWCDRYKTLRFLVSGKRRRFVNGQFVAQTQNERDAVRNLTQKDFIFEGDDVKKPIRCRVCRAEFYNSDVFQDHMARHVLA